MDFAKRKIVFQQEARELWKKYHWFIKVLIRGFGIKLFLGYEQPEGFTGPTQFYLVWCPSCSVPVKDYLHGYTQYGKYYVRCFHCRKQFVFMITPFSILSQRIKAWRKEHGGQ